MKKNFDYNKEQSRGTLKQIMKVRGLRTISIANYFNWLNTNGKNVGTPYVHSLKLDLQDGYINAYGWKGNKCGEKIEDLSASQYTDVLAVVQNMLVDESKIPYRVKRNIFVKMCR
jgi:hypothetical protein